MVAHYSYLLFTCFLVNIQYLLVHGETDLLINPFLMPSPWEIAFWSTLFPCWFSHPSIILIMYPIRSIISNLSYQISYQACVNILRALMVLMVQTLMIHTESHQPSSIITSRSSSHHPSRGHHLYYCKGMWSPIPPISNIIDLVDLEGGVD